MSISQFPVPSAGGASAFSRSTLFTSSGTFVHPDGPTALNPTLVKVVAISGGGGGGSGAIQIRTSQAGSIQNTGGASGGSTGALFYGVIPCEGALSITIGAGGAGGASASVTNIQEINVGNSGSIGGRTIVDNGAGSAIRVPGGSAGGSGFHFSGYSPGVQQAGGTVSRNNYLVYTNNTFGIAGSGGAGGFTSGTLANRQGRQPIVPLVSPFGDVALGGIGGSTLYDEQGYITATVVSYTFQNELLGLPGDGGGTLSVSNANAIATVTLTSGTGYAYGGSGSGAVTVWFSGNATRTATNVAGSDGGPGLCWIIY